VPSFKTAVNCGVATAMICSGENSNPIVSLSNKLHTLNCFIKVKREREREREREKERKRKRKREREREREKERKRKRKREREKEKENMRHLTDVSEQMKVR
jgi:hypothetical protein